jgi:hypothetical protein
MVAGSTHPENLVVTVKSNMEQQPDGQAIPMNNSKPVLMQ